jgi:hypothetical protein
VAWGEGQNDLDGRIADINSSVLHVQAARLVASNESVLVISGKDREAHAHQHICPLYEPGPYNATVQFHHFPFEIQ